MTEDARLLRLCCWIGAAVDAFAVLQMLSPRVFALFYGLEGFSPGPDYRFAMGMGASLMAGWTALLLWAARKPVERRAVLLLTVFPVIAGLALGEVLAIREGFIDVPHALPAFAFQALYAALCLYAVRRADRRGI